MFSYEFCEILKNTFFTEDLHRLLLAWMKHSNTTWRIYWKKYSKSEKFWKKDGMIFFSERRGKKVYFEILPTMH